MRVLLLVCIAIALTAGCTNNSGSTTTTPTSSTTSTPTGGATSTTPTTTGGTTPTLTPPSQQTPILVGNLTFDSLTLNFASIESQETLLAIAHVTNHGPKTENPLLSFAIDDGTAQQAGALIGPNAEANVSSTFHPETGGDHVMHAKLGPVEKTVTFHVRAPTFTGFTVTLDPTTPCQAVKFNGTFSNTGDGTANDTVLTVTITDNAQIVSKPTTSLAYVAAGTQPHLVATDAAFHAACNTAPHAYALDATLYWQNVQQGHVTQTINV